MEHLHDEIIIEALMHVTWNSKKVQQDIAAARVKAKQEKSEGADYSDQELKEIIRSGWHEMRVLEGYASRWKETPKNIDEIRGIWVPSGPGFIKEPYKEDRYKDFPWSQFMGRHRLMYAARLMRKTAEARSKDAGSPQTGKTSKESRVQTREIIKHYGPALLFNGIDEENKDVQSYLEQEGLVVPPSNVHVMGTGLINTLDQVHNMASPEGQEFLQSLGENTLSIVTHVPHAARLLHLLGKTNPFPSELHVSLLPLPTPSQGIEYKRNELCGILAHIIRGQAAVEPFVPSNISFDS